MVLVGPKVYITGCAPPRVPMANEDHWHPQRWGQIGPNYNYTPRSLTWMFPKIGVPPTRWAPTSYKWSYKPYKWPYKWLTGVITLLIGVITPFITSRGPPTLKSSILIGFFIINHPFWGTSIFGNTHIDPEKLWLEEDPFLFGLGNFSGASC